MRRHDREAWRRDKAVAREEMRHRLRAHLQADRAAGRGPWGPHGIRPRPDWWPEDEPWPPEGGFPWRRMRRLFFIRIAIVIAIVFSLVIAGPILVLAQLLSVTGLREPASIAVSAAMLFLLFAILASFGRGARRFAVPFGDLIEAAGRVEDGDYSVRVAVPRRGWRELRGLIESFNSMVARLETDEAQRRTLLADVSHELRTPLAVLRGELEAMIDGVHPIDEAHLTAAVDQIGMLTKLVEDLRTLALAEAGTLAIHPEPTDLSILLADVAESFEGLAAEHQVRIEVAADGDLPLVDLDPLRMRQVIGNLVANALRYAPLGTAVTISARTAARDHVTLQVVDHGPGVSPELLPHLFERFTKSDDSRGSGLGLAIARRLVETHGGSITAECPAAGGTVITLELPLDGRNPDK